MTTAGAAQDTAYGRVVSALFDTYLRPRKRNPSLPPVVFLHGAFANAIQATGQDLPSIGLLSNVLLEEGFTVLGVPHGPATFGNTTAKSNIATHLSWARTNLGTPNVPPVVIGASMGGDAALSYAANNAVACVVGLIPLVDLQAVRVSNVLSLRASIDAAWGVTYPTALPSMSNPNASDMRTALSGKPMDLWYASDDTVSENIAAFASATGAATHSVGALGHTEAAILAASTSSILSFIQAHI